MRKRFALAAAVLAAALCGPWAIQAGAAGGADAEKRARAFVEMLHGGQYEEAAGTFDATMASMITPEKLEGMWSRITGQHGPLRAIRDVCLEEVSPGGVPLRVTYVTCEFERASLDVKVVYDLDGRVAGLFVVAARSCSQKDARAGQSEPELEALARKYLDLLVTAKYAEAVALYDHDMAAAMPEDKTRQTWEGLNAQIGPFSKVAGCRMESSGGFNAILATCLFGKTALDMKVVFDGEKRIAGLFFLPAEEQPESIPPAQVDRSAFEENEVRFGEEPWVLPGTLSIPRGKGPFPAVVLVHGSGPNDRDESVGPSKPFRDLAWGLAGKGIAVLRYEKRTKEYGPKVAAMRDALTVQEETVDDALAAVGYLRTRKELVPERIFVLGHSLGGFVAPRIGKQDAKIGGLVIVAGSTRPLEDLVLEQTRYLLGADGSLEDSDKEAIEEIRRQVARVKDPSLSEKVPASDLPLGIAPAYWLDLRAYDPVATAAEIAQPLLIIQAGRDY